MTRWIKTDEVYMLFTKGRPSTKTWRENPRRKDISIKNHQKTFCSRVIQDISVHEIKDSRTNCTT